MTKLKANLLDDKAIKRSLIRISHEIIEKNKGVNDLVLIGIKRRGYPLAKRIANNIEQIEGVKVPVGYVDISLYRDDISEIKDLPEVNSVDLGVEVKGKKVILVDDVLYTCRTVRAAIDAIIDVGRPLGIQLAVLIDRGHKELPIRADYVGKNIPTSKSEIVAVEIEEIDGNEWVKIYEDKEEIKMEYNLIATTTFGLEGITSRELKALGYEDLKVENGKVEFVGDEMDIAIANVHLRTADRVFIKMAEFEARSFEELFQGTKAVKWSEIIPVDGVMHVVGKSVNSTLHSVPDCQSIVKKAIVTSMSESYGVNTFSEDGPVYKIQVAILKDKVTLSIDTSGSGLHKRGYREDAGIAPLKETLAAALVLISRWKEDYVLIDPFCC